MSEQTFNVTKEDVRRVAHNESVQSGGNISKDSDAAALQSIIDQAEKSKASIISERQANLPLPDQPPVASDWQSANANTVNVGSGAVESGISTGNSGLREPATGASAVRVDGDANKTNTLGQGVGRESKDGLSGIPNDAVSREAKGKAGLADTTN